MAAIVGGVYAAELDHWRFTSKHWDPATTRFWIPDAFYGGEGDALDLTAVGKGVAAGEHLFVNTYLLGVTTFAAAGNYTYARYAAELAACESEDRLRYTPTGFLDRLVRRGFAFTHALME